MTKLSDLDASPGDVVGWSGFEYRVMDGPDPNGTPCEVWAMHKGGDWITQDTPCCRIVLRDGDPMTQTPDTITEAAFADWFRKNYPGPDTIIHKPDWHAPKIYRAATHALAAERDALRAELAEARGIAACAYQSWKMNAFDVQANQKALLDFSLKERTND